METRIQFSLRGHVAYGDAVIKLAAHSSDPQHCSHGTVVINRCLLKPTTNEQVAVNTDQ